MIYHVEDVSIPYHWTPEHFMEWFNNRDLRLMVSKEERSVGYECEATYVILEKEKSSHQTKFLWWRISLLVNFQVGYYFITHLRRKYILNIYFKQQCWKKYKDEIHQLIEEYERQFNDVVIRFRFSE